MTSLQPDLFGTAPCPVEGLAFRADMITPAEEAELAARIDGCALEPFQFHGWEGKRLTASFGSSYDFARGAVLPAPPIPDWLLPLRSRMAQWTGLAAEVLTQALVIRYDPGAGIGWHKDRPQYGKILGLSLGAAETLRLRRRKPDGGFARHAEPLHPRAAYSLDGPARWEWEHSITPVEHRRWSVTFRSFRDQSVQ
ncbi:alpha-ketoglutarate-dependent dioxygenase AlkB [Novosphingobium sp. MMS21-SN21R]|uniref:alpha-ketoglutarate-dependent dioxygenase AlkB n=1 Tax=Novosphingobium sp. MMS21-SN21R TaxID=2969298 RepID=UPI0028861169|nr:alpha-ketoglutarate-dependent dioxygenase AlkB [Novosphingobium sp. MMS21-SN21R]MDT0509071.1 alpha-ketoglutarate-dependent dioxygenase AlkB [Novosphingobium sp. MMS21-SN21R]